MATERLTDIELESVQLHEAKPRTLTRDPANTNIVQEDDVETAMGPLHVCVQGDRSKRAIFTYHDIGLNSFSCFQGFFNFSDMQPILKHFCVYHITAPGQQEGALPLPQGLGYTGDQRLMTNYQYPTMDQLGEMIAPVMQFYGVKSFVGFGMGAGGNILSRFALKHPEKVDGLVLLNCSAGKSTWAEWGYQKANCWYLRSGQLSQGVQEYLLWHWFGSHTMRQNHDLVQVFSENIASVNPQNLAHFIDSYIKRDDLGIERTMDITMKDQVVNFKCPVMLVAGSYSPHLDEVVKMNSRLDPADSTWMKFECGGMVMEECPKKLAESFRLFLQGMGFIPTLRTSRQLEKQVSSATSNALLLENAASAAAGDTRPAKACATAAAASSTVTQQQTVC